MPEQMIRTLSQDPGVALAALLGGLAIVGCATVSVAAIVMVNWRKMRQSEDIHVLKQSMIDQGMSADEIARVIEATPQRRFGIAWQRPRHKCSPAM